MECQFIEAVHMNKPNPISYTIKRIGEKKTKNVHADSFLKAGDPPSFHFSLKGSEVLKIFVHALENEPTPNYPPTAAERDAWRKLVANSRITPRRLR
jgi:hypothetical protein